MDRRTVVRGRAAAFELVGALEDVPAEVGAAERAAADAVDLLPAVLTDVADEDVPGPAVEREPVGVAEAERVDLVGTVAARERVPPRDRVVAVLARVDPQQLAEQDVRVLGVAVGVAGAAAVAGADVEEAVGAELELAAVVVREARVGDLDHLVPRARRGAGGVAALAPERVDLDVAGAVDVVDVEAPVALVTRVEGDREQPLLAAVADPVADVEEVAPERLALAQHADRARLLDHEQELGGAGGVVDVHGRVEAADAGELERAAAGARGRARGQCGRERDHRGGGHRGEASPA